MPRRRSRPARLRSGRRRVVQPELHPRRLRRGPVVQANLLKDLIAHEMRLASPYGGNQDAIDALEDKVYVRRDKDSQLCPVTRFGGVGVLTGLALPSLLVHKMKGSDYRVRKAARVVVDGGNPYAKPMSKYE